MECIKMDAQTLTKVRGIPGLGRIFENNSLERFCSSPKSIINPLGDSCVVLRV